MTQQIAAQLPADTKPFLPNLFRLRFISSLFLILLHLPTYTAIMGFRRPRSLLGFLMPGENAIIVLFVVSGFLITNSLLHEYTRTNAINVREFYWRRSLRILPPYYLIILLTIFFLPFPISSGNIVLNLLILSHIGRGIFGTSALAHLWTISVQEVFYIIHPWLVKASRNIPLIVLGIIAVRLAVIVIADLLNVPEGYMRAIMWTCVDCVAIGGLGAWLVYVQHPILKIVYHPVVIWGQRLGLLAFLLKISELMPFEYGYDSENPYLILVCNWIVALFFTFYTLNITTNPRSRITKGVKFWMFFGAASYGIYIYHLFIIYWIAYFLNQNGFQRTSLYTPALYFLVAFITIVVSLISYYGFERPLQQLRYESVKARIKALWRTTPTQTET